MWAMRLTHERYGTITEIKNLDVKTFIDLIHYDNYLNKYEAVLRELNQKK